MKKFAGTKPLSVILNQCMQQHVPLDLMDYRKGAGHILLGSLASGHVYFNTLNGKFHGMTDKGVEFDSSSIEHESEPWFEALLSFFYVEKESGQAVAPKQSSSVALTLGGVALIK